MQDTLLPPSVLQCATFLAASGIVAPLEARKAALARFRAKKARSHFAPKVRYHERKKLAEARPRYKGQFIKISALPKELQLGQVAGNASTKTTPAVQTELSTKVN